MSKLAVEEGISRFQPHPIDILMDDASRVTEVFHNGPSGPIEDLFYTYDSAGNRISFSRTGPQADLPAPIQASHNAANQQVQFNTDTLTYDLNGNLIFDGTTNYTWDARNRLAQISGPGLFASFAYDAFGRRVSKSINTSMTKYLYDSDDIISEIRSGAVYAKYLRGDGIDRPFLRSSSMEEYYHTDALGSAVMITDSDGMKETTYTYDPFGYSTTSGVSNNAFQFTGRENDGFGLYYYRARYYSPDLGRFLNEDPLYSPLFNAKQCRSNYSPDVSRFMDREPSLSILQRFPFALYGNIILASALNPQYIHLYTYANDNPANKVDPLGLLCKPQTPGCDRFPDFNRCTTKCCNEHDNCYCRSSGWCDSSSWYTPFPNDTTRNWDCDVCNYIVQRCIWRSITSGGNGRKSC